MSPRVRWYEWVVLAAASVPIVGFGVREWFKWDEVFGFITGGVCVWLVVRQHILNFPFGLANNVCLFVVFLNSKLYADMGLQVVFFVLGVYGWWVWVTRKPDAQPLKPTHATLAEWISVGVVVTAGTFGLWAILIRVQGEAPFWDALIATLSIAAQYLLSHKRIENWYLWIVADLISIPLYIVKGIPLTAALYTVFLGMCVVGLVQWWKAKRTPHPFDEFRRAVDAVHPTAAVVLGSGLSEVANDFTPTATVAYADIPGLVPPTVAGHRGQMAVGHWAGVPTVVCYGRVHFYEGHPWERVTTLVRLLAEFGVRKLILTNAAGGIRDDLNPGDLMAIRGHIKLLDSNGWRVLAEGAEPTTYPLLAPDLPVGVYAALTGPCYETPAEIRALRQIGADAVGMSTAVEAEAAVELGMTVAGVSCITNKAAGLAEGTLSHHEVEQTARTAVVRLSRVLVGLIQS
jgi:purine-nucleoside phosphorylase